MYICTCTTKVPVTLIASEQHIETNTKQIMIEQVQCHVESVIQAFVHYVMYFSYYYPITSPRKQHGTSKDFGVGVHQLERKATCRNSLSSRGKLKCAVCCIGSNSLIFLFLLKY